MNRVYEMTVTNGNGSTVSFLTIRDGLAIVNHAMMGGKSKVRTMNSSRGNHSIVYKNGNVVKLIEVNDPREAVEPAPQPRTAIIARRPGGEVVTRPVVTVRGKDYVFTTARDGKHYDKQSGECLPTRYVSYWSVRNGERFGSVRTANVWCKPGSVGRAIWDAINV
jgi:hypothetical protein